MAVVAPISWSSSAPPPCLLLPSPYCGRDELRRAPLPLLSSPSDPPSSQPCHDTGSSTTMTLPQQRVRPPLGPHRVATTATATSLRPCLRAPRTSWPPQLRHSRAAATIVCSGSRPATTSSRAPEPAAHSPPLRDATSREPASPQHTGPRLGAFLPCFLVGGVLDRHPRGIEYWRKKGGQKDTGGL